MVKDPESPKPKPVRWIGRSLDDLKSFPDEVQRSVGVALWAAQIGSKAPYTKPLKGYSGAGVLEIVDDFDGNTYRAVYTVRFSDFIFVLHAFQKKSKRGIETPKAEIEVIDLRLKRAKEEYEQWQKSEKKKSK